MTVPGPGGFPFPGAPGAAPGGMPGGQMAPGYPGAQPQQAGGPVAFVLDIPPDPTWEPIDSSDTLEKDGFYCVKIVGEKPREDDHKLQVIFTLELQDPDVIGKKIARFLPHPTQTKGDTWFLWRGLMRSIGGTTEHGKQAMRYTPGMFTGHLAYVKTGAYGDKNGNMRTGVDAWVTKPEWEEAVQSNRHRWVPTPPKGPAGNVGALPSGLPGFPGMQGAPAGMPPMPGAAMPGVPQPAGPPMQQPAFPPQQPAVPTMPGFPNAGAAAAPQPQQPQQPATPGFPPQPPAAQPQQPPPATFQQAPQPGFPAFPQNGAVPQPPNAASIAAGFPGAPPR